jgi:hypothetical protein
MPLLLAADPVKGVIRKDKKSRVWINSDLIDLPL